VRTSDVGKCGSAALAAGVAGCTGGWAEVSVLANGKSAELAVGLGGCAVFRRGCWRLPRRTLRRWSSVWAGARGDAWKCRSLTRAALQRR